MSSGENTVQVARNGSPLGIYDFDKLGDLLERGQLLKSDQYFDEATGEWVALGSWEAPDTLSHFRPAEEKTPGEEPGSSRRRGGRSSRSKKKGSQAAIFGWIACLFALVVAAGIYAYSATLQERLADSEKEIKSLNARIEILRRENQLMTEVTPANRVRAIITYEPTPNQVAIMSGATVGLYRRSDVEAALQTIAAEVGPITASTESFEKGVEALKGSISSPIEISLTDSNGRVDIPVPEAGDYVLVASAGKSVQGGVERYLWLMGFRASQQPSALILLNEKNATSLRKPAFSIVDVPSMASGTLP